MAVAFPAGSAAAAPFLLPGCDLRSSSAGVFGRFEYLNQKIESYSTSSIRLSVSSKSASVSPGNPTMISVVIAMFARVLHPLDPPHVFVARVEPLHRVQNPRRSRLHRQMHVIAQRPDRVDRVDDVLDEIARMRCREPDPPQSGDLSRLVAAAWRNPSRPAKDRDSCLRSVPAAELRYSPCRPVRAPRAGRCPMCGFARAARKRHDAISAGLVAPFNDGDVRRCGLSRRVNGVSNVSSVSRLKPVTRLLPDSSCTSNSGSLL